MKSIAQKVLDTLKPQAANELKVLSYNVQVGMNSTRPHHYVTHSWKHILPHSQRLLNMDQISNIISGYDVVGLQEVDAGSLRSNFINLTEYLAEQSGFPYWYHQVNRNLGRIAQHSNGLLSHYRPLEIQNLRLPGFIPGRRAIMAIYETNQQPIVFFILHLALGSRARINQLSYISEYINEYKHVVVMGDLNCRPGSPEMCMLFKNTDLHEPLEEKLTFPSWRPQHNIDHILVTPELRVNDVHVVAQRYSDHLPISMSIQLPEDLQLVGKC